MENKLKELFVPFDIAKKMCDMGFDEMCLGYWFIDGSSPEPHYVSRAKYQFGEIGAPVWSQVIDWIFYKWLSCVNYSPYRDIMEKDIRDTIEYNIKQDQEYGTTEGR